jgi:hypothetical protein
MKLTFAFIVTSLLAMPAVDVSAQKRTPTPSPGKATSTSAAKSREIGSAAIVIDETLSVLRTKPSLFAEPVQRMRRGRKVQITGVAEADGVRFYKVTAPPNNFGWVQSDAVFGTFRPADEERLVRLIQATDGFDQIEIATEFFRLYPRSQFLPAVLLLYGDLLEEVAARLSKDSVSRLTRREMAASGAPEHSYFLNFVSLDRYRKLGITFLFNSANRTFHYDGSSWNQILAKHPASTEAAEAAKRLDSLKRKMTVTLTSK